MDAATKEDAFGGYTFAIRTFYFTVTDLQVHRYWSPDSDSEGTPDFYTRIAGKAISEDRVGVIGREGSVNEFNFSLRVDTYAKEKWNFIRRLEGFADGNHSKFKSEHIRIKKIIIESFDENPPTAVLGPPDAGSGGFIECMVRPDVLAKLEEEIAAKTASSILVGVDWTAGLVSDGYPTTWGMFCLEDDRRPESMGGYVSLIKWSPTKRAKTKSEETDDDISDSDLPAPTRAPVPAVAPVTFSVPKSAIAALWVLALAAVFHLFK